MAKIVIEVNEQGKTTIKVQGVKGPSCLKLTKNLEEKLGTVKNRQKTKEYYEKNQTNRRTY